jgi:hypothetical protein
MVCPPLVVFVEADRRGLEPRRTRAGPNRPDDSLGLCGGRLGTQASFANSTSSARRWPARSRLTPQELGLALDFDPACHYSGRGSRGRRRMESPREGRRYGSDRPRRGRRGGRFPASDAIAQRRDLRFLDPLRSGKSLAGARPPRLWHDAATGPPPHGASGQDTGQLLALHAHEGRNRRDAFRSAAVVEVALQPKGPGRTQALLHERPLFQQLPAHIRPPEAQVGLVRLASNTWAPTD